MLLLGFSLLLIMTLGCWNLVKQAGPEGSTKLAYLEGARGMAALIVVLYHLLERFYPASIWGQPNLNHLGNEAWFSVSPLYGLISGTFCVAFFFVLSGFVLSFGFLKTQAKEKIISAGLRRYFRLAVPVLFMNILYFLALHLGFISHQLNNLLHQVTQSPVLLNNYVAKPPLISLFQETLVSTFYTTQNSSYNTALWTMSYELYGSFIVFLSLLLFGKWPLKWRLLGCTAIFVMVLALSKQVHFLAFTLGLILCDLYISGLLNKIWKGAWKYIIPLSAFYLASFNDNLQVEQLSGTWHSWVSLLLSKQQSLASLSLIVIILGASLALVSLLLSGRLQTFFSNRFCSFLGRISFSLYLGHFLILYAVMGPLFLSLQRHYPYNYAFFLSLIPSLLLMFILAEIGYKLVDRASVVLGKRVYAAVKRQFTIPAPKAGAQPISS